MNIELNVQTSGLVTERYLNEKWHTIIGALIGSVLGGMEFIGLVLVKYETYIEKRKFKEEL